MLNTESIQYLLTLVYVKAKQSRSKHQKNKLVCSRSLCFLSFGNLVKPVMVQLDVCCVFPVSVNRVGVLAFFFNKTNNKCVQERQKGPAVLILLTVVGPIMLFWS